VSARYVAEVYIPCLSVEFGRIEFSLDVLMKDSNLINYRLANDLTENEFAHKAATCPSEFLK
jgi:hypothetical protein